MRKLRECARQEVSIHARQYWRAMPVSVAFSLATAACFNPRPPILAGDAESEAAMEDGQLVSIHARQYWRAMPAAQVLYDRVKLFQSTPANTGGRCVAHAFMRL